MSPRLSGALALPLGWVPLEDNLGKGSPVPLARLTHSGPREDYCESPLSTTQCAALSRPDSQAFTMCLGSDCAELESLPQGDATHTHTQTYTHTRWLLLAEPRCRRKVCGSRLSQPLAERGVRRGRHQRQMPSRECRVLARTQMSAPRLLRLCGRLWPCSARARIRCAPP